MISHEPLLTESFPAPAIPLIPAAEGHTHVTTSKKAAQRISTATTVRTPSKRRKNRNDALARLEGRARETMKAVDHERKSDGIREHNEEGNEAFREVDDDDERDFMLMTDDDESVETHMQFTTPPPTPIPAVPISAPISGPNVSSGRVVHGRRRRSTMDSWFPPLSNFMDLRDDRERCESGSSASIGSARMSMGWRSVVGVVTAGG